MGVPLNGSFKGSTGVPLKGSFTAKGSIGVPLKKRQCPGTRKTNPTQTEHSASRECGSAWYWALVTDRQMG